MGSRTGCHGRFVMVSCINGISINTPQGWKKPQFFSRRREFRIDRRA
jgi:hypothetical protein